MVQAITEEQLQDRMDEVLVAAATYAANYRDNLEVSRLASPTQELIQVF